MQAHTVYINLIKGLFFSAYIFFLPHKSDTVYQTYGDSVSVRLNAY